VDQNQVMPAEPILPADSELGAAPPQARLPLFGNDHPFQAYPLPGWKRWVFYMMLLLAVVSFAIALTTMPVVTGSVPA
jgi:hypothetical protein